MQSASVDMVQTCLLSFRLLSISSYFLALIITLYFAHVYICFSSYLNSSPGSSLWSGHIHVSYGSDLITFRPNVLVDVLFQWKFLFLSLMGKY